MNNKKTKNSQETINGGKERIKRILNSHFLYISLLVLIVLLLFSSFIFSDKMLLCSDQLSGLDSRVFYRNSLIKHRQFPMWFSPRLGGMPTVDALFGDALYLPSVIIHLIFHPRKAIGIKIILHVILAGILFYIMLYKGFKAHPFLAFTGAVFYMLNPELVSHVYPGHDGKMFVIAWLPFIIWRMKCLMDKPSILNMTLLSSGIGASLLTSHIQMTYFILWGLFFYWLVKLYTLWREDSHFKTATPYILYFWGAIFIGLGIGLIQLLPAFMYVRNGFSVRGVEKGFDYAASWSLHWPEIFSLWIPEFGNYLGNYWSENYFKLNTEYTGAMAIVFAVFAVVYKPKTWRIFWAAIALFAALFSLGAHTPVFHIAYYIVPGVQKFRACSMIMFWFSFSIVILSSLFLIDVSRDELSKIDENRKRKWVRGTLIAMAAITLISLIFSSKGFVSGLMANLTTSLDDSQKYRIFENNFQNNFIPFLWLWWFFAIAVMGLLVGLIMGTVNKYLFLVCILAIGLIDTIRTDTKFIQVISPRPYFYTEPELKEIKSEMNSEPFRCYILPGVFKNQNVEGVHGLESIVGFHDNELNWYRSFRGETNNSNYLLGLIGTGKGRQFLIPSNMKKGNNFLDIANVKYIITRQRNGKLIKFNNRNALKRISFVKNYKVFNENEITEALRKNRYDIRKTTALLEEPSINPQHVKSLDSSENRLNLFNVDWQKYTPNYRKAKVKTKCDGFLRISEVYYPGWKIKIDGKPVKIYRADLAWMAVNISKGEHIIEMEPNSLYLWKASVVSIPLIIGIFIYWGYLLVMHFRKRRI